VSTPWSPPDGYRRQYCLSGIPSGYVTLGKLKPTAITSAQSYANQIERQGDSVSDPPELYMQTVQRLLAEHGPDYLARLLAFALRDLDRLQGRA
jgi:hypothetical protein